MESKLLPADYLLHEKIYANHPAASGWNEVAVDREILLYVEELLSHAQVAAPADLLEVGCGMGNLSIPLARAGWRVTGIDISMTALERAARRAREAGVSISFHAGNVALREAYPARATFDCVLDGLCWHCMIGPDRQVFLHGVKAVLRPQGCFLIMTMCGEPRSPRLQTRFDPVSRCITNGSVAERYLGKLQDLASELTQAGLMVIYQRLVEGNSMTGDQDLWLAVARKQAPPAKKERFDE